MDFIDELKQFSKRVESIKDKLTTEEATKSSIIMPFFAMLGYDVFNPDEFMPEFTADVGIKKGEKVDYAILVDGSPVILIEAKWVKEDLKKHDSQLFRYFGTSKAKFAILTNGIIYRFFTDLDEPNKMDSKPFLEVNILDIKESQVKELKKFKKSAFSVDTIMTTASQLKYTNEFKNIFTNQLQEPSNAFVEFFLSSTYSGKKTSAVVEKFKPIVKDALNQFISETMNDKIKTALGVNELPDATSTDEQAVDVPEPVEPESKIVTTEEELEGFFYVRNALKDIVDIDDIVYKDNERYMAILYKNKTTKWICRLYFNSATKYLALQTDNKKEERVALERICDIEKYKDRLVETLKSYL